VKILAAFLSLIGNLSPVLANQDAGQVLSIVCKINTGSSLVATYDYISHQVVWTQVLNGVSNQYTGVGFQQYNKAEAQSSAFLKNLAQTAQIDLASVNSANEFILQQSATNTLILVDFDDVNAQSLGTGMIAGTENTRCN
jgi:hypothetical protein